MINGLGACPTKNRRGNGFALEYQTSRILNIFEGAAEIQAQVIARRLME